VLLDNGHKQDNLLALWPTVSIGARRSHARNTLATPPCSYFIATDISMSVPQACKNALWSQFIFPVYAAKEALQDYPHLTMPMMSLRLLVGAKLIACYFLLIDLNDYASWAKHCSNPLTALMIQSASVSACHLCCFSQALAGADSAYDP